MVRSAFPNLAAEPEVNEALLAKIVRQILSVGNPRSIILFGSHARGSGRPHSDLDLLIIEDSSDVPTLRRATIYRMALTGLHPRKDIVVCTADEVNHWRDTEEAFLSTAIREGRILYERPR